jgi:two-component SAPR family response regulator
LNLNSNIFNVQKDASLNDKYIIIKTKHFCIFVHVQECEVKAFQQLARRLEKMNLGTDRQPVGPECHVRIFKSQIFEADPEPMGPPRPLKRLKVFESA